MILFEKYKIKKPAEFTRLVGVNYGAFLIILEKLEAEIVPYKSAQPMRQRGLKSSLTVADQRNPSVTRGRMAEQSFQVRSIERVENVCSCTKCRKAAT